ncbi:MAG: hypothetical protein ACJAVM_000578 [Sulfitobacter sp.]|jgi:hypothetical protein
MSKPPIPLNVADISGFARHLAQQLQSHRSEADNDPPSHLTLMNMLARAAGFGNFQHFRAAHSAQNRVQADRPEVADFRLVERCLHHFDDIGRLQQWPARRAVQELCLWALWSTLPAQIHQHEKQINAALNAAHRFGDAAILRRSLVGMGLLSRNSDGSDYLRLEKAPPPEALALIRRLQARRAAAQP